MTRKQAGEQANMRAAMAQGGEGRDVVARSYDEKAAAERMERIAEARRKKEEQLKKAEEKLAAVPVEEADIKVLATQFAISEADARRKLQEHKGQLLDAVKDLMGE